ncbi:ethanolamine utilization protein EutH [Escherichia coli]|uniref:ethanolamine utilization protein EutH n=1 Tax=Escherichia coli TaxID=562 RepID=UPI0037DC5FC7
MYIMMFFMLIAAVDRILSQFGGSARFLGSSVYRAIRRAVWRLYGDGALGLAMVGMTALAPVLAHVLGPVIIPVYDARRPVMFAGTAGVRYGRLLPRRAGGRRCARGYTLGYSRVDDGANVVFSIPVRSAYRTF